MRGGGDEHLTARGADSAQRVPVDGRSGAATGSLGTIFCFVEIGLLNADIFPIDVKFVGDNHGQTGFYALADFRILADDGDNAVSSDAEERGGQECGGRDLWRLGKDFCDGIKMKRDEHASAGDSGDAKKTAAIEKRGLHGASCNEWCDSGEGRHLHRKHCKPILGISEF